MGRGGGCHSTVRRNARGAMRDALPGHFPAQYRGKDGEGFFNPKFVSSDRAVRGKEDLGVQWEPPARYGEGGETRGGGRRASPAASRSKQTPRKIKNKEEERGGRGGGGGEGAGRPPPPAGRAAAEEPARFKFAGLPGCLISLCLLATEAGTDPARRLRRPGPGPAAASPARRSPGPASLSPAGSRPTHAPSPRLGRLWPQGPPGPARPPLPPRTWARSAPARAARPGAAAGIPPAAAAPGAEPEPPIPCSAPAAIPVPRTPLPWPPGESTPAHPPFPGGPHPHMPVMLHPIPSQAMETKKKKIKAPRKVSGERDGGGRG